MSKQVKASGKFTRDHLSVADYRRQQLFADRDRRLNMLRQCRCATCDCLPYAACDAMAAVTCDAIVAKCLCDACQLNVFQ